MRKQEGSYTAAVADIEAIVAKMESGDLDVDDLLESVKRASKLIGECRARLRSTEESLADPLTKLAAESPPAAVEEAVEVTVVARTLVLDDPFADD